MELRNLENIGVLDRHRVEDVSKYTDAETAVMLQGIFGLTDVPAKSKALKAKEIYLLADGTAKKPLGNLPVLPPKVVAPTAPGSKGGGATGAVEAKKGLVVPISVYRKGQDLIANYPPPRPPVAPVAADDVGDEKPTPTKFSRNKAERRKALKRDADDPNSGLTDEQRKFIKDSDGHNVPKDCEVSHEKPLYIGKTLQEKEQLDVADNMKTMQKPEHRQLHRRCGNSYHEFPLKRK